MIKEIFVNLPVKDLQKSIAFFTELGFTFNPQFTDENATCMILGEKMYAMLLVESFFQTFTKKTIIDAHTHVEGLFAISLSSRQAVDEMVDKALKIGGVISNDPQDYGWMYSRSFQDLDGHIWEALFTDEEALKKDPNLPNNTTA